LETLLNQISYQISKPLIWSYRLIGIVLLVFKSGYV
jgi:hypothetical protein